MVKARTWLALVLISFGTVAATVGCGSDEVTGSGAGGGLITGGSGGAAGSGAGTGGAVGRGGAGGAPAATTSLLGSTCTSDLDCGDGLKCVTPDDATLPTSGGPANGLCTLACTTGKDCDAVSPGAGCVNFGDAAYCFESCTVGDPADITTKCHGRPDEVCDTFASGAVLCSPLCRADAECGTGLYCDHDSGLCTKTKPTGDPPGTPCDPMAATNNCLGTCLITTAMGVTPEKGQCAQLCPLGVECLYNGTKPGGLCAGAFSADSGALDLGFCEAACSCTRDCTIPGDVCQAWTSTFATYKADIGSAGFCYPNADGSTEVTSCGTGGGAGTGNTPPGGDTAGAGGSN